MTRKNKNVDKEEEQILNDETKKSKKLKKLTKKEKKELCKAIENGDDEKAKSTIEIMSDVNEIMNYGGGTALNFCCDFERIDLVKYLIDLGVNVNKITDDEYSPLMSVAFSGSIEMVKLLIDAGADVNFVNEDGESSLSVATEAEINALEKFELLISSGVDMAKCGGMALVCAANKRNLEIVQRLIDLNVDINHANLFGWTSLHFACQNSFLDIVKLLLENGADENIKNNDGKTATEFTENEEIKEFITNYNSSKFVLK